MGVDTESGAGPTIERLRQSVITWSQGLGETGGTLMPAKCSWSILDYIWMGNRRKIRTAAPTQAPVMVLDARGKQSALEFLLPSCSVEVVGFHQSLDGSMAAQFLATKEKATGWATSIRKNYADQAALLKGLRNTIWPSERFPLLATTFTRPQGDDITKPLICALLPKLVVNRNYPSIMRYAPRCYGGLRGTTTAAHLFRTRH